MPWPYSGLQPYYPYAGTLFHTVKPYRIVTLQVGEEFPIPPNVTAFLSSGPFTLKLADGTSVPYASAPGLPISLEAIYPKGKMSIVSGAGGPVNYSLFSHA